MTQSPRFNSERESRKIGQRDALRPQRKKRTKYTLIIFLVALGVWAGKQVVNS
jgi:hypothetical protein